MTDTMQTIHRKICLEFSNIKMSFTAFSIKLQAQRHVCQRHAKMFMKASASKVLPKSLSEFTSMSDENVRETLKDMDGTRPLSTKSEVTEDINTFSQTLMREHPEFRAHCGRAFTQYKEIRHLRGKLKPMTEAPCQVDYAENWQVDYASK